MGELTEDSQEDRHQMLRAIGINPVAPRSNNATLPLNLTEMRRLIQAGVKVDGCRDRYGSTALGVAAQLGRVDAMKVLIEAGANLEAVNLDGASPLSLAVFGRSAAAVAMLLVYGGESLDYAEALSDARATGARDVLAVFDAWSDEDEEGHPLIEKAERMYAQSESILAARQQQQAAGSTSSGRATSADDTSAAAGELAEWRARAEAAEQRARAAEERARAAEERAAEWEVRAIAAEQAIRTAKGTLPRQGTLPRPARLPAFMVAQSRSSFKQLLNRRSSESRQSSASNLSASPDPEATATDDAPIGKPAAFGNQGSRLSIFGWASFGRASTAHNLVRRESTAPSPNLDEVRA